MPPEVDNVGTDIAAAIGQLEGTSENNQGASESPTPGQQPATPPIGASQAPSKPDATGAEGEKPLSPDGKPSAEGKLTPPPQPPVAATQHKAPVTWKPEAREKWAKLDPDIQAEISRRELEMSRGMRTTTEARQFKETFDQMVIPYIPYIQAEGATPIQAVQNMLQTALLLRTAPPQQKAMLVAQLIQQHGVDIPTLDQVLSSGLQGQPMGANIAPNPALDHLRQEFRPALDFINQLRTRQQSIHQQTEQQLEQTLEQFAADPANEFFSDVQDEMADILEFAANKGRTISLQDAYDRAIMQHPTISKIVTGRKLGSQASQLNAAAERAANAAVSVRSDTPSRNEEVQTDGSIRSDLSRAIDQVAARSVGR